MWDQKVERFLSDEEVKVVGLSFKVGAIAVASDHWKDSLWTGHWGQSKKECKIEINITTINYLEFFENNVPIYWNFCNKISSSDNH